MNVYRVAVMKNATRVIGIHNHPSGHLEPSEDDTDITDRLIQVGKILNIVFDDHLIISPTEYISFRSTGLMDKLERSLKYVPTYQLIEQVRSEEKVIAKDAIKTAKDVAKAEREQRKQAEQKLASAIYFLNEKSIPIEQIAAILEITPKRLKKLSIRKSDFMLPHMKLNGSLDF